MRALACPDAPTLTRWKVVRTTSEVITSAMLNILWLGNLSLLQIQCGGMDWRKPGVMPCIACRAVAVRAVYYGTRD